MGICKISRYSRRGSTLSKAKNCVCFYLESIESNYDDSGYENDDDSGYDSDDSSDDNNDVINSNNHEIWDDSDRNWFLYINAMMMIIIKVTIYI